MKNWLIGKDPDAGKDWRQEEKGKTEGEMVGWHHWLHGHEFDQAAGVGDGQGSLVCFNPRDHEESDMTEWLNYLKRLVPPGSLEHKVPHFSTLFREIQRSIAIAAQDSVSAEADGKCPWWALIFSLWFPRQDYWSGVAISFSRGSSWPRDQTHVSCIVRQILYCLAIRQANVKLHLNQPTNKNNQVCLLFIPYVKLKLHL